jgi:hypothetical protein
MINAQRVNTTPLESKHKASNKLDKYAYTIGRRILFALDCTISLAAHSNNGTLWFFEVPMEEATTELKKSKEMNLNEAKKIKKKLPS